MTATNLHNLSNTLANLFLKAPLVFAIAFFLHFVDIIANDALPSGSFIRNTIQVITVATWFASLGLLPLSGLVGIILYIWLHYNGGFKGDLALQKKSIFYLIVYILFISFVFYTLNQYTSRGLSPP